MLCLAAGGWPFLGCAVVKALRGLLAANGLVFLLRGGLNLLQPTSFYLAEGAPENAMDAVRILGITYGTVGVIQLGMLSSRDRNALRVVAGGSMLFAAGVAAQALAQGREPSDTFHQIRNASAAENIAVAALYAGLLYREGRQHRQSLPTAAALTD
jgi:hypothetical protein